MLISVKMASSTHLDLHYERMSRHFLENSAIALRESYCPLLIDHDFDRQIGVILNAKVAELPDGEYGLFLVIGEFQEPADISGYETGQVNVAHRDYDGAFEGLEEYLSSEWTAGPAVTSLDHELDVAELLAIHLDSTKIDESGEVYKVKRHVASIGGLEIHVFKDHLPAHFHVISKQRKMNARFSLETLEHLSTKNGVVKADDLKKIIDFFQRHPDQLAKLRAEHLRLNA
jgi:hypothetical protein